MKEEPPLRKLIFVLALAILAVTASAVAGTTPTPAEQASAAKQCAAERADCRVSQAWVALCTAARRASSTWLRRCPTVCWAARVCE